jgi:hypothetical protein
MSELTLIYVGFAILALAVAIFTWATRPHDKHRK